MAAARHCVSWADLQPELLGLVLKRIPSLADRIRLAAVCRQWRLSVRREPVPCPFPWLTLHDGTFLDIADGKIYRLPSSSNSTDNSQCICFMGNWLFLEQQSNDGGSMLSLVNPFSKDVVQFPNMDTIWCHEPIDGYSGPCALVKVVLLSSTDPSPDSLFAVLITGRISENVISICQPSTASAFRVLHDKGGICDVAFVDGKLYALSSKKLFVYEVESRRKGKRKFPSMKCIANDIVRPTTGGKVQIYEYFNYLVESNGKLLLVERLIGDFSILPEDDIYRTFSFEVFEVDLTTSSSVQWRRLNSLEGKALFVGTNSKVLHSSEYGVQADCIYFMCDHGWGNCPTDPLCDSGVFNMRNGMITPLLPENMVTQARESIAKGPSANKFCPAFASWFFPN